MPSGGDARATDARDCRGAARKVFIGNGASGRRRGVDGNRFDEWVRTFGAASSRRSLIGAAASATVVGVLAACGIGSRAAAASDRPPRCRDSSQCPAGSSCQDRVCVCDDPAKTLCDGACVDLQTYNGHCGACGRLCPTCLVGDAHEPAACVGGQCVPPADGRALLICGERCVDPRNDKNNCGGCGQRCGSREHCEDGECLACPPGQVTCRGIPGCVDLLSDPANCNGCFNRCPEDAVCDEGSCRCPAGTRVCNVAGVRRCIDTTSDGDHCGRCGRQCNVVLGEVCRDGTCVCADPSKIHCEDRCVDLRTFNSDCGACGHFCPVCHVGDLAYPGRCLDGQCVPGTDQPGYAICKDECVDTNTDRRHCGACGHRCSRGAPCVAGRCGCDEGERQCGQGCCPEERLCCDHTCCAANVTTCHGPSGSCGCGSDERVCGGDCCPAANVCCDGTCCPPDVAFCDLLNGGCCPPERTCDSICCPIGQSCLGGVCCPAGQVCGGTCCPEGNSCQSGVCRGACTHPAGVLTIRGETCCPTGGGNSYFCGRFKCDGALSQTGPGGCDLWCSRPDEGSLCGPDVDGLPRPGGGACCCTAVGTNGTCVWP